MKKLVFPFVSLILLYIFVNTYLQKPNKIVNTITPTPLISSRPQTKPSHLVEISNNNETFQATWTVVSTSSALQLYPNFKEKLSALEVKKNNSCTQLTSAGFYDKNNNPLGLFVNEGKILSPDRPNAFFNGYFSLDNNGNFSLERNAPDQDVEVALQSGPLLWLNKTPLELKIIDDKPARRIIVGITKDDKLVFLTLFNKDNNLDGPLLAKTPNLLSQFVQKTGIVLDSALNLDGGSASAFYSEDISLSELSSVGGFFCIK